MSAASESALVLVVEDLRVSFPNRDGGRTGHHRSPAILLMALRRVAPEAIDDAGLGGAQQDPVARGVLQRLKEAFAALDCLFMQIVATLEFALEGELVWHQ